jgi:hypothetical protein
MEKGKVSMLTLTKIQNRNDRSLVMRAYVEDIGKKLNGNEKEFRDSIKSRVQQNMHKFVVGTAAQHLRSPVQGADLLIGGQMFLEFAKDLGAITEKQSRSLEERITRGLRDQIEAQALVTASEDPIQRFLQTLQGLLAGGVVALAPKRTQDLSQGQGAQVWLGWEQTDDPDLVHLIPDITFEAVSRAMGNARESMPLQKGTLYRRMADAGIVTKGDPERPYTVQRRHALKRSAPRVLEMHKRHLGLQQSCSPPATTSAHNGATTPSQAKKAAPYAREPTPNGGDTGDANESTAVDETLGNDDDNMQAACTVINPK